MLFLLFSMLLGGIGDMDFDVDAGIDLDGDFGSFEGPGISPLSLPILLTFGGSFGAFGGLLELEGSLSSIVIPFVSGGISVVVSGGMYMLLLKVFVKSQASTVVNRAALVGQTGQVTIPVAPGSIGQVLVLTEARGRTLLDAVSSEEVPRDAAVRIIELVGNAVKVEKIGD